MVGGGLRIAGIGAACCGLFIGFTVLHETGIVGVTRKSGTFGCVCHNPTAADSVMVWVSGPESVRIGTRYL